MYNNGDLRTDEHGLVWQKKEDDWVAVQDANGNHLHNPIIKPFDHGIPHSVRTYNATTIGSTQLANIQNILTDLLSKLQRIEEIVLNLRNPK